MNFTHIIQNIDRAERMVAIAKQVWDAVMRGHEDTHALGQALIEAGQELQGEDPVPLS